MMNPTPRQIRAAMALLEIDQVQLAERSGIARRTLQTLIAGDRVRPNTLMAVRLALQGAGIVWIDGADLEGVAIKPEKSGL